MRINDTAQLVEPKMARTTQEQRTQNLGGLSALSTLSQKIFFLLLRVKMARTAQLVEPGTGEDLKLSTLSTLSRENFFYFLSLKDFFWLIKFIKIKNKK